MSNTTSEERKKIVKEFLGRMVRDSLRERKLTQRPAAKLLNTRQQTISRFMTGETEVFSVEKLLESLAILGTDVSVALRPVKNNNKGKMSFIDEKLHKTLKLEL